MIQISNLLVKSFITLKTYLYVMVLKVTISGNKTNIKRYRKTLVMLDRFVPLIVVMVPQIFEYAQICQVVHIKYA